jgi:hypothetical protein
MPQIDFYFDPANLTATANHLANLPGSPFFGQAVPLVENQLVPAAVNLFVSRFQPLPSVNAILVNDGVLHAAVLWKGIGAIFSASSSVSGNAFHFAANVTLPISGQFVVSVDLWCNLG